MLWASLEALLLKNLPAMQETPVQFLGREDPWRRLGYPLQYSWALLVAQLVKNLPAMRETWVRSLGWDLPQRRVATHSSILAWRSLVGYSPWSCQELDVTERLSTQHVLCDRN